MSEPSRRRFPVTRDDGSFSVEARFRADSPTPETGVRAVLARAIAVRTERDHIDFSADFLDEPTITENGDLINVAFHGRPGSTFWKDWLVALCGDLQTSIAGLHLIGFRDLVSGRPHPTWPQSQ